MLGRLRVCADQHHHPVGAMGQRSPDLAAVDPKVVPLIIGAGAQRRQVGAGLWLAVPLAPLHFAAGHRRKKLAFLLLRTINHEGWPQHPSAEGVPAGCATIGHLFVENQAQYGRCTLAAVLRRPVHGQPAPLRQLAAHPQGFRPLVVGGRRRTFTPSRRQLPV